MIVAWLLSPTQTENLTVLIFLCHSQMQNDQWWPVDAAKSIKEAVDFVGFLFWVLNILVSNKAISLMGSKANL